MPKALLSFNGKSADRLLPGKFTNEEVGCSDVGQVFLPFLSLLDVLCNPTDVIWR